MRGFDLATAMDMKLMNSGVGVVVRFCFATVFHFF